VSGAVSIVIPTWNGRHLLEEFLPSVVAAAARYTSTTSAAAEIVIVDDGSTDDTKAWVTARAVTSTVPLRLIGLQMNGGFAAACNAGARAAVHPRMLLLNNDLVIEEDAIAPLVAHLDEEATGRTIFAVHCRMKDLGSGEDIGTGKIGGFARGFLRVHKSYVPLAGAVHPWPSMFATGGAALFDRARFLDIGGFDTLFAPFYFEDVELSYRAWKRGWDVAYEPASVVRHRVSSTIGRFRRSTIETVSQRNRLLLHWIHLTDGPWLLQHALWVGILAIWSVVSFRPAFARAVGRAVRLWPDVRARRHEVRAKAVRTDRDVVEVFHELQRRSDIAAYDRAGELTREQPRAPTRTERDLSN
jgi:GT2 family glycosyltransferase